MTEEITKLESDKKILQSASAQLIEEKHQLQASVMELETSVMQVQAESNQLKTENKQQKTEIDILKTENSQQRNQIAAERIQLESHHKEEKLHLESRHQREKQILQFEVERLTKELEHITTLSISKKSLVSTSEQFYTSKSTNTKNHFDYLNNQPRTELLKQSRILEISYGKQFQCHCNYSWQLHKTF